MRTETDQLFLISKVLPKIRGIAMACDDRNHLDEVVIGISKELQHHFGAPRQQHILEKHKTDMFKEGHALTVLADQLILMQVGIEL